MPHSPRADVFGGCVINVKHRGAKGNGTDDTDELEAAITASHEGDAFYFPPGTYLVSRALRPKANQLYFSLTHGATITAVSSGTGFSIFELGPGPVEFRHLTLDGSKAEMDEPVQQVAASGIRARLDARGAFDVVVFGCRIRKVRGDGIHIARGQDATRGPDRVIVRDTVVTDCGGNGLGFSRVGYARVESSLFERCNNGIKIRECDDVLVHGVTASANRRHGIVFTFSRRWHVDNCVARGNGTGDHGGWGIAAGGEPTGDQEPKPQPNRDFTVTNNICEDNDRGGITLDPTVPPDEGATEEEIWPQRARVSGNVCRNAERYHGIHLTHSRHVVVTDNVCAGNKTGSGIQLVSSSHVLVQGNACFANRNGIGLFSDKDVTNPGHHVLGINMLYGNENDVFHQEIGAGQPLKGVRIHGLHGADQPEGAVKANPGTLYEWHKGEQGGLFVKESGSEMGGWRQLATL